MEDLRAHGAAGDGEQEGHYGGWGPWELRLPCFPWGWVCVLFMEQSCRSGALFL